jgi:hypothetical protein
MSVYEQEEELMEAAVAKAAIRGVHAHGPNLTPRHERHVSPRPVNLPRPDLAQVIGSYVALTGVSDNPQGLIDTFGP